MKNNLCGWMEGKKLTRRKKLMDERGKKLRGEKKLAV